MVGELVMAGMSMVLAEANLIPHLPWLNDVMLMIVAALQWISMHRSKVRSEINRDKITEVSNKQDVIHGLVNGKAGVILNELADALETIARMTRREEDILSAVNARTAYLNFNLKQEESAMVIARAKADRAKVIEDFLNKNKAE